MKPFRFFMKGRPEWLDLPNEGEDRPDDCFEPVGTTMPFYNPTSFDLFKRLIYWSESQNQHYYGGIVQENSFYFNYPLITNPIRQCQRRY